MTATTTDPDENILLDGKAEFEDRGHRALSVVHEHGQPWLCCSECGAQWSANEAAGPNGDHWDFERVSEGDSSCEERHAPGCICADCSGAELTADND